MSGLCSTSPPRPLPAEAAPGPGNADAVGGRMAPLGFPRSNRFQED